MKKQWLCLLCWSVSALLFAACPKNIPQPEIDAAENSMSDIEQSKDCAPETYQAAKTMMDKARALLKEERYEEAKTALLAAQGLAEKARQECEQKRKEEERLRLEQAKTQAEPVAREIEVEEKPAGPAAMVTVFFGFDQATLSDEARQALGNNAEYLGIHQQARVQVAGHCDERGSTEYNLSLGERRAQSVRSYLVKMGVNPTRIDIISYGEEQPANPSGTEEAWSSNRRAEFQELK